MKIVCVMSHLFNILHKLNIFDKYDLSVTKVDFFI